MAFHRLSPRARRKLERLLVDQRLGESGILGELRGLRAAEDGPAFGAAVEALLDIRISEPEAEVLMEKILRHRDDFAASLGREVALEVAAEDYFASVHAPLGSGDAAAAPNAVGAARELELACLRGQRHAGTFAFLVLDAGRPHASIHAALDSLRRVLRSVDRPIRLTEIELGVILSEADRAGAAAAAERIVVELARGSRDHWPKPAAGVACFPRDGHTPEILQSRAREACDRAKQRGENRVEMAEPETGQAPDNRGPR